jgi:hypothetical protein
VLGELQALGAALGDVLDPLGEALGEAPGPALETRSGQHWEQHSSAAA